MPPKKIPRETGAGVGFPPDEGNPFISSLRFLGLTKGVWKPGVVTKKGSSFDRGLGSGKTPGFGETEVTCDHAKPGEHGLLQSPAKTFFECLPLPICPNPSASGFGTGARA
ncbi:MAG: hypothetical protein CM15mP103_09610 [Gammaproteobacteria bacterium]|nr:MAG: hypothetical protein CM15mP103_09610 [Gammaproteobacteria bacterium]